MFSAGSVEFEIPQEYEVLNTFDKNGILTVYNREGDGADVLIVEEFDFQSVVSSVEKKWSAFGLNKNMLDDSLCVFRVKREAGDPSLITNIVILDKTEFVVLAYIYEQNESSRFHGEFGEQIITMLKSIRKGEGYEKAWTEFIRNFLHHIIVDSGKG